MLVVDQIVWVKRRHIFEFSQNTILHKRFNAKNQARGHTLRPQKKTRSIQILDIFKMNSLQMSPDVSSLPSLHSLPPPHLISWPRLTANLPLFLLLFASPAHVIDAHLPRSPRSPRSLASGKFEAGEKKTGNPSCFSWLCLMGITMV